jgi:ectoine hydroxylase-related dioxygenase (phytanoyl-CoA dioxygenase family)
MQLSPEDRKLLPTADDIRFYQEHGYFVTKKIFTDAELDAAAAAADRYYAGQRTNMPGDKPMQWGWKAEHGDTLRKNDWSTLQNPDLMKLVKKPILGAIGAQLAGTNIIRLWHDQLLWKPTDKPNQKANVGWHTDRGYWKTCSSPRMLTAWVPFHDCDEEMGSISFVDGSNLWPDNTENLNFFSNDLEGLEKQFVTGGKPVVKVVPALKKGQVTFHSCLTIHGSGPNKSPRPRRSMAVHMQDASNRWQEFKHKDGKIAAHGNDMFDRKDERGLPDYTDPEMHPVLWEE